MSRLLRLFLVVLIALSLPAGCGKPPEPTLSLSRAVRTGDLDQIKRHIAWGTDLDQRDADGDTPLHVAARAGQVGIVRELADSGADLDARNAEGRTPMELALAVGRTQAADALLDAGAKLDPQAALLFLVRAGVSDRDSFDFLIRRGADLDRPDADGEPPLHIAVSLGHLETAKRLLARGADVNRPDAKGDTPLALAERLDLDGETRADMVQVLTQYGARAETGTTHPAKTQAREESQ